MRLSFRSKLMASFSLTTLIGAGPAWYLLFAKGGANLAPVPLISLGMAAATGFLLAHSLTRPVRHTLAVTRSLADGDLSARLQIAGRDEFGEVAKSLNQLAENVRGLVQSLDVSTGSVLQASEGLSSASDQAAQAAQGVAQSVTEIARNATEQADVEKDIRSTVHSLQETIQQNADDSNRVVSEVQQVSTLIKEMSSAMERTAGNSQEVAGSAVKAAEIARSGGAVLERTVESMESIRDVVEQAATRIRELGKLSNQISAITETITGISVQTNMLALNAAIEAARAGEQGRGFSVVADEVRKLASRSATAAREIAELIHNVRVHTDEAVTVMEAGTARVEEGSRLAVEAGGALREILATVDHAADEVAGIAALASATEQNGRSVVEAFESIAGAIEANSFYMVEMGAGASTVDQAVEQIAATSQSNAGATEDVSAGVEELSAAAQEVAASAQTLLNISQELRDHLVRFKL